MNMSESDIRSLINDVVENMNPNDILDAALKHIDLDAMKKSDPPLSKTEIYSNIAMGGFIAGIDFTLRNLEEAESEE